MKVDIINQPLNWKSLVWTSARTCYSAETPMEIHAKTFGEKEFEGLYNTLTVHLCGGRSNKTDNTSTR